MQLEIIFLTLGALFLTGLAADQIGRRTQLPRVTLLLACGLAVGRAGFDLLPSGIEGLYEFLSVTALTMVAFLLGSSLTRGKLVADGRAILCVSLGIVLVTLVIVSLGLIALGVPVALALVLASIATATAPAATQDVIRQSGRRDTFVATLSGIVAIDDAWGLIVFSVIVSFVGAGIGPLGGGLLGQAAWEIGGALLLGVLLGLPASYLTGRLQRGEPQQAEALGIVFLCAGLSLWLEVSYLIAAMTMGVVVVNMARHHSRAFHEIEHIQWPFMILFFILAGASLELAHLTGLGLMGLAYIGLRIAARIAGGWLGGTLAGLPAVQRNWIGIALMPQAGVAIGMALVAVQHVPEHAATILTLTVATTVVFELIGPLGTQMALRRVPKAPS